jgi:hypothetical protein
MKRCFIEVDLTVDDFDIDWIEDRIDRKWDEFFNETITDAARLMPATWNAIKKHDEIWYNSSFIGPSGNLLMEMLEMAIKSHLKDKKVINLHDSNTQIKGAAVDLINKLSKENNIQFIFRDSDDYPLGDPK